MSDYTGNSVNLNIPANTKDLSLNKNRANIIVGSGCSIATCNSNQGSITFLGASKISEVRNNIGKISIGAGSSVTDCFSNLGLIDIENGVTLERIRANKGTMSVGTGAKISRLFDNTGTIFVSSGAKVENIRGNCKEIHFGPKCTVELVEGNKGTVTLGKGSIVRNVSSNSGSITIEGQVVHVKSNDEVKKPLQTSIGLKPTPSLASKKEFNLCPTNTKTVTRDTNKLKAAMLKKPEEKFPTTASKFGVNPITPQPHQDKVSPPTKDNFPSAKKSSQPEPLTKLGGIDLSGDHNPSAPSEDEMYSTFQESSSSQQDDVLLCPI